MKLKFVPAALSLCLIVAACKPSENDVSALVRETARTNVVAEVASMNDPTLTSTAEKSVAEMPIVVGDINQQLDGSYIAIYTLQARQNFINHLHMPATGTIHMLKGANGWVLIPS